MNKTACIFPGQGSQSVGMLSELATRHPAVGETFRVVSDALGYDIWQVVQDGPQSLLDQTTTTQVAMLAADVAVYRALRAAGFPEPYAMAGHSLGEYPALVCAGALSLADAATLVLRRATLMQQAVTAGVGAMAAIVGLEDDTIEALCHEASTASEQVSPANYNAIGQVVVAGHTAAVARVETAAEKQGARLAKRLPVSVPCHCPLMTEAAGAFGEALSATPFQVPSVMVLSNVDMSAYTSAAQIRTLLVEQLYKPVRWVQSIQKLGTLGVTHLVECGPGRVLAGLSKRIDRALDARCVQDCESFANVMATEGVPA